jgi:hypothetical protein
VAQITASCVPQVESSSPVTSALLNPPKTTVTFWDTEDDTGAQISASIPAALPLEVVVLVDVNGQSVAEATSLVQVLKQVNTLGDLFGAGIAASSEVAVRLYTESDSPGPVLQLGGGSSFRTDVQLMVEDLAVSFLLANEEAATVSSTRLLELSAEILASWPQSHSSSTAAQVLLVVAPNSFSMSVPQWSAFINAVRASNVLPIFYAPNAEVAWPSEFTSLWQAAFPGTTVPLVLGSRTPATAWQSFSLSPAVDFARTMLLTNPIFTSDSQKISASSITPSGSSLTISLNVAIEATATPFAKPTQAKVGILGLKPVVIETLVAQSPSGTDATATLQFQNRTELLIPVSNDVSAIKILTLPTQGRLFAGGVEFAVVPRTLAPTALSFEPNANHGVTDSFTYALMTSCGEWGPYTMNLKLGLVPLSPVAANGALSLTEDDLSEKTVDLNALVTNASPTATITLLSLPSMVGFLNLTSTGLSAQLSTAYPISSAVFEFSLYRASRVGSKVIPLTYMVDNGLGAISEGVFTITVTDVEHAPAIRYVRSDAYGNNFIAVRDADNNTVSLSVMITGGANDGKLRVCIWQDTVSTCQDTTTSTGFVNVQTPAIITVAQLTTNLLSTTQNDYLFTATDSTSRMTSVSMSARTKSGLTGLLELLGSLLGGVVGLVGSLLTGLTQILTLNPNNPSGTTVQNCIFMIQPKQASLIHNGIEANDAQWSWASGDHTATYSVYNGVSGRDDIMFQCGYSDGVGFSGPISHWIFNIPITTPNATQLGLTPAPDAPFAWIPIQGLISEGGLSIQDVTYTGASSIQLVTGGIRFFATQSVGSLSYRLCSLLQVQLCSDLINNTINLIDSLPILGAPSQNFVARLNGTLNTFTLDLPVNIDGIRVQALSPLNLGTLSLNGVPITTANLGTLFPVPLTMTYTISSSFPITANLLSLYSFTFVASKGAKDSQPGSVFIMPDELDLLPLLPTVIESVNELVDTLDTVLTSAVTLIPGFRIEIDVFGKKETENIYDQLKASLAQDDAKRKRAVAAEDDLDVTANVAVPEVGKFEICDLVTGCEVIDPQVTVNATIRFNQTVYYTPPLLSTLYNQLGLIRWTVRLTDGLLRFTEVSLNGVLNLANDLLSDTLRVNVLGNTSPALRLEVPGVRKLLTGAGLDPDGCGDVPPSPLVCVDGQLVANSTVVVDATTWPLTAPQTTIVNGGLHLTTSGVLQLSYIELTGSHLPFVNVSGDVLLEGHIQVSLTRAQLNYLIFDVAKRDFEEMMAGGGKNESSPKIVVEGKTINSSSSTIELLTEDNECYGVTLTPGHNGRPTLALTFSFAADQEGCSTSASPSETGNGRQTPAQRRRNQIIWISCAVAGGVVLILLLIAALMFRYNKNAKRLARPFSVRRLKGQAYRTQPSSEMTGSTASAELGVGTDVENVTPYSSAELIPDEIDSSGSSDSDGDSGDEEDQGQEDDLAETEDTAMPQTPATASGLASGSSQ